MISASQIKQFKNYQQKKFRRQDGVFVAETPKVAEVLLQSSLQIEKILALESWWNKDANQRLLLQWERRSGIQSEKIEVSAKELERISGLECPQEVWMLCRQPDTSLPDTPNLCPGVSLVLDELRDPGNMGTIIRMADWFGIDRILCTEGCADVFQPKCVQSSMGSVALVPVYQATRERFLEIIQEKPAPVAVYGTFMKGGNIYKTNLDTKNAWYIIGNEAHGIGADFEQAVHHRLTIPASPKHESTGAESLNAAIAAAILCSEIQRNA
ncbi:MAG: RNA methyltransferase [Bacteroides sp.]|nr:RNA methyltransferase [Bacteroides sp.]MCM1084983.1 RNA methyltransferase [Bacteroides sp.]